MDTSPTHQAPSGPMTRARTRAIENEVNSLLYDFHMDMDGTWMLPHKETLCVIRYEGDYRQEAKDHRQVQREPCQGHEEDGGENPNLDSTSQATPCARASQKATGSVCAHPVPTGPRTPCARASPL